MPEVYMGSESKVWNHTTFPSLDVLAKKTHLDKEISSQETSWNWYAVFVFFVCFFCLLHFWNKHVPQQVLQEKCFPAISNPTENSSQCSSSPSPEGCCQCWYLIRDRSDVLRGICPAAQKRNIRSCWTVTSWVMLNKCMEINIIIFITLIAVPQEALTWASMNSEPICSCSLILSWPWADRAKFSLM